MLDRIQYEIARLSYSTIKKSPPPCMHAIRPTGKCALVIVVSLYYEQNIVTVVFFAMSVFFLLDEFWNTQKELANLDNERHKKDESTDYISGEISQTRSGWANDPKVLRKIPRFLSTRVLTCFTLVECVIMVSICYLWPQYGGFAIAFGAGSHYITDALDGAVGRFRKEGFILWGYYADHCFDAVYEFSSMFSLWLLCGQHVLGAAGVLIIGFAVQGFHAKEYHSFTNKLSKHYSNLIGTIPLHYLEFLIVFIAISTQLFGIPWIWIVCGVTGAVSAAAASNINYLLQK